MGCDSDCGSETGSSPDQGGGAKNDGRCGGCAADKIRLRETRECVFDERLTDHVMRPPVIAMRWPLTNHDRAHARLTMPN